jgi:hypothetical protein
VLLSVTGMLMIGYGAFRLLTYVRIVDLVRLARWAVVGWVVNDLLIMPTALLLGAVLMPRIGTRFHAPLRAGLLALCCLVIITGIAIGSRPHRRNITVIPNDPIAAFAIVGCAVLVLTGGAELIILLRHRRRARRAGCRGGR